MRSLVAIVAASTLAAAACADPAPTETLDAASVLSPSLSTGRDGPPRLLNTQLTADAEIPMSTSESRGHAHLKALADGTIESLLKINNSGGEVLRFCHIHWINPNATPAGTGPIVWFLTPVGQNLQRNDPHFDFRQNAVYVANSPFGPPTPANMAAARAALLADPSKFYVNCHSNAFPPGFIRGNLP